MLSFDFRPRHKWIEHILTAVLAIIIDQEKTLKIDGPEDFEKHMLLNVVSRLVCRAIIDMDDVVAITESVCDKAAEMFHSSVTFIYKFNGVKRELKKLKLIPDWLWCEIRDDTYCRSEASVMPSFKMKTRWRPNRRVARTRPFD